MPDRWQAHGRRKEIAQIPLSSRDLSGKEDRCPAAGPPRRRISVCSLGCVLLKSHIWQEGARDWVEVIFREGYERHRIKSLARYWNVIARRNTDNRREKDEVA